MPTSYCEILGIHPPTLASVKERSEASSFSLMIVALLERGAPMTLAAVAERFAAAGIAPAPDALRSLQRCRPDRSPIYRAGDLYELDVHSHELDLWLFRLGLRGPKLPPVRIVRREPEPLPGPDVPLSPVEIEAAFKDASLTSWSGQRLAVAMLDSRRGRMSPVEIKNELQRLTRYHIFNPDQIGHWRAQAIRVDADGSWTLVPDHPVLRSARKAVRSRLEMQRRRESQRPDPAVIEAQVKRADERAAAHAAELAALRRCIVHGFPAAAPRAASILDIATRTITTYLGDEMATVPAHLAVFDFIGALGVRPLLRALGFDPGDRVLAELGPPQKTRRLNRQGRTLAITTELLIRGSCGISRPLGDRAQMEGYLRAGQLTRFRRRFEADLKSLLALHNYGRLHHAYRLRWGFLDEMIHVAWVHWDEPSLFSLMRQARKVGRELRAVTGTAPGWEDPWSRSLRCRVLQGEDRWQVFLVDEHGFAIDERDVQMVEILAF
jgi:hypothetical protein